MSAETRGRGRLSLNLVVLCLFLGWLAFAETQDPRFIEDAAILTGLVPADEGAAGSASPALAPAPVPLPIADRSARALPAVDAFSGIAARSLFNPTRRPIEPPAEAKAIPAVKPSRFRLVGVLISDGLRMALIRRGRASDYTRVEEGQEIDGWRIERIVADRVVIRKGDTREELILKDQPAPQAAPRKTPKKRIGPLRPKIRPQ